MSSSTIDHFQAFGLPSTIMQAVDAAGYETPSPIQAEAIPPLLAGRDLLGQAQTGTGKTAAFALPLLSQIDLHQPHPQLLVLTPTRELALQVAEAMQTYARFLPGFHILPIYGGQGMVTQLRSLRRGVHAVVGTPGRILDHLGRGTLQLDHLVAVVLDEADEMLRMGFIDDVEQILQHTPAEKQMALFSATLPAAIKRVAMQHMRDPVEIRIASRTTTATAIEQRYLLVNTVHKLDALTRVLEHEEFDAMLVFVRTKTATVELAEKLEARGFASAALNGDIAQPLRERTVERLRNGQLDIVVATDVAARGLDVERISHVVNYDIPTDVEAYVHRIGRTGRAGRKGVAILFALPRERRMLRVIEQTTRQAMTPMPVPTLSAIADRRSARFLENLREVLEETLDGDTLSPYRELLNDFLQDQDIDPIDAAAALTYMAQKDRPLFAGDEPEPTFAAPPPREARGEAREHRPKNQRRVQRPPEAGLCRYRIEVGRNDGVMPKNIVGAIANEINLNSRRIGQIQLYDDYSTVDLPDDLPASSLQHLQKVWVCQKQLRIAPVDASTPGPARRDHRADHSQQPSRPPRRSK
jgi:ATP-dependent RNA helicase DeaD